jgi:hypothetical protein
MIERNFMDTQIGTSFGSTRIYMYNVVKVGYFITWHINLRNKLDNTPYGNQNLYKANV